MENYQRGLLSVALLALSLYSGMPTVNAAGFALSGLVNPFALANNPCSNIRNGQFVCLDCSTLAFCVQEGGDWNTIEIGTCATERQFYCNEEAKSCSWQRECEVPTRGMPFECQNSGLYPDPYDCKYYHECDGDNRDTRHVCPSGFGYSVSSRSCSIPKTSSLCREPQYVCERPGDMAAWPGDDNLYYVCFVRQVDGVNMLYPRMYRCGQGRVYDGRSCVLASGGGSPSVPQLTPATATATATTTTETVSIDGRVCSGNSLMANPTNCRAYYSCMSGQMTSQACPLGTYFNTVYKQCVMGNCP